MIIYSSVGPANCSLLAPNLRKKAFNRSILAISTLFFFNILINKFRYFFKKTLTISNKIIFLI